VYLQVGMYRTGFTCMNYLLRFGEEYRQYTCPAYMIKINQSNNISDPSEINLMYEFASRGKNFPKEQKILIKFYYDPILYKMCISSLQISSVASAEVLRCI
jgi:hypothetical protein